MTCPIDGRPLHANAVICGTCEGVLDRALGDLDALLDELDVTLTRQARKRPARGNQASDGAPLMFDARASEAGRDLRVLLKDWVSLVAEGIADEGRFVALPMPATCKTLSAWLTHHTHWIACHDTAADAYTEIVAAVNNIRRTIDIAPDARFLGPCGNVFEGVECVETVYAIDGNPVARCRTCGTSWDVQERTESAAGKAEHVAQTIAVLTQFFRPEDAERASDRIGKWVARGYLKPYGIGPRKRPTYIVAHVARLIGLYENKQKLTPWPDQEQETA